MVLHSPDGLLGNKKGQMLIDATGANHTSTRPHERSFTQEVTHACQILAAGLAWPARSGLWGCGLGTDGVGARAFLQWPGRSLSRRAYTDGSVLKTDVSIVWNFTKKEAAGDPHQTLNLGRCAWLQPHLSYISKNSKKKAKMDTCVIKLL